MGTLSEATRADERQIQGHGTPESTWQAWPDLLALPRTCALDLVPHGARAVMVAPHPDDEILGAGGLIAELARHPQGELVVVAVTDGTASHPGSSVWPPERLALERPRETRLALDTLGAHHATLQRLAFPDGELGALEAALVQALKAHVRPGDVVFTPWRLDGHPDHEACGRSCAESVAAAGATLIEIPVWTWHWACPGDKRVPWHRACQLPLSAATLRLKQDAVQAFQSQITPDSTSREGCVLPPHVLDRLLRPMEVFFR